MQLKVTTRFGVFEGERLFTKSDSQVLIRTRTGAHMSFRKSTIVDLVMARDSTLPLPRELAWQEPQPRTAYPVLSKYDGAPFFEQHTDIPWTATLLDAPHDATWSAFRQAWLV